MSGTEWSANHVRHKFVEYFIREAEHTYTPSSSVSPGADDPTLLFINAGMNQFKRIFLGTIPREEEGKYPSPRILPEGDYSESAFSLYKETSLPKLRRTANYQKCIRAGGKHNDLEDVGKDEYHHTFFEMLGNWSFGDFEKEEAIHYAYDLLVNHYGLDPERMYVTYFAGDKSYPQVQSDEETKDIWLKYLPKERILPFSAKDNFWEMAETGPCGPCTEIHYDKIGNRDATEYVNADDPTVIEIWNLVFMSYQKSIANNNESDPSLKYTLKSLPFKCVDTGMGLERLCAILQNKKSNYDTDLFLPIFNDIQARLCPEFPYTGSLKHDQVGLRDMAYRVVADHMRCLTIAINDGIYPSREKQGYVIRRILRRAQRIASAYILSIPATKPFLYPIVHSVLSTLNFAFPDMKNNILKIESIIKEEEELFLKTLHKGEQLYSEAKNNIIQNNEKREISGDIAFTLYTTFGFPLDLTQAMAADDNLTVDVNAFNARYIEHQKISTNSNFALKNDIILDTHLLHCLEKSAPPTDDTAKYLWDASHFATPPSSPIKKKAKIVGLIYNGQLTQNVNSNDINNNDIEENNIGIILDSTNYYAEGGGQIADIGIIEYKGVSIAKIRDVKKYGKYILHIGKMEQNLSVGMEIFAIPDLEKRCHIAKNHTATHILNHIMRKVFNRPVKQKGSYVDETKFRFDYDGEKPLTEKNIQQIQDEVNSIISQQLTIYMQEIPINQAKKIDGLRTVDNEVYPDPVRVVSIGVDTETNIKNNVFDFGEQNSVEFCGGTHISNTKIVNTFIIGSEESISRGIRRLTCFTGKAANDVQIQAQNLENQIVNVENALKTDISLADFKIVFDQVNRLVAAGTQIGMINRRTLQARWDAVIKEKLNREKARAKAAISEAKNEAEVLANNILTQDPNVPVLAFTQHTDWNNKALDAFADAFKNIAPQFSLFVVSTNANQLHAVAIVGNSLANSLKADVWMKALLLPVAGRGGGNANKSTGAAKDVQIPFHNVIQTAHQTFFPPK